MCIYIDIDDVVIYVVYVFLPTLTKPIWMVCRSPGGY